MENKKLNTLSAQLQQTDALNILQTISELREEGNDHVLPVLAQLYVTTSDSEIQNAVSAFFNDLQNQSSASVLIDLIHDDSLLNARKMLISSCWQSRLNYILYLEKFIELVFNQPFEIAFEAFTVIENLDARVSVNRKTELIAFIEKNLSVCRIENRVLANDLTEIISKYEE